MPYEIHPDGRVRADTPDEVAALWALMKPSKATVSDNMREPPPPAPGAPKSIAGDKWDILMKLLSETWQRDMRTILSTVKSLDQEVARYDLCELLGYSSSVLGGKMGGLVKNCRKAGLDPDTVIIRTAKTYRPGPLLREYDLPWDAPKKSEA
jgi:hypothetical protein